MIEDLYLDQNGKPIKGGDVLIKWGKLLEDPKIKIVKQQTLWTGFWVSTVWLGINHNWGHGKPLIYETMVFFNDMCELDMDRYSTRKQAEAGHKVIAKRWSNPFYAYYRLIKSKLGRI